MIRLDIVNDGTGTDETGNYDAWLYLPKDGAFTEYHSRVEDYPRTAGWAALVQTAVVYLAIRTTREEKTVVELPENRP